jgi:predicted nucleic acid-binding Zn ribbon protein
VAAALAADSPLFNFVTLVTLVTLNEIMTHSLRSAVVAEWRGLPERKMRPDRWQLPADLMPKLMQRLGLRERLHETEVIDAWSKIVGDFIAAHSSPVALREGILYVRVLQPALHYELEQISKPEILRKLKQRFGGKTIRDIRFRVG